jgi:hypothetical protein
MRTGVSMTINFRCPECQQLFRAQEAYAGRQWHCPKCSTSFPIPQPEIVPVEMVTERPGPSPRRRERRDDYERDERDDRDDRDIRIDRDLDFGWLTTRRGLHVTGIGLTILLVAFVVFLVTVIIVPLLFLQGGGRGEGLLVLIRSVSIVLLLAIITMVILWIVGQGLCCSVPGESGGKPLVVVALICSVVALILGITAVIAGLRFWREMLEHLRNGPNLGPVFQQAAMLVVLVIAMSLVLLVGFYFYLFFLRSIAVYFRNDFVAINVIIYMIVFGVCVAAYIVYSQVVSRQPAGAFGGGQGPGAGLIAALIILFTALILFAWLIHLVSAARTAIPKPGGERRRRPYYADED